MVKILTKPQIEIREASQEFKKLRLRLQKEGILDRDYGYYFILTLAITFSLVFFITLIYQTNSTPLIVLYSLCLCIVFEQIGGLMHDAGHMAIFNRAWYNNFFGFICGIFVGANFFGWQRTHNVHHKYPNQINKDPDIDLPFYFTKEHYLNAKGIGRLIRKYQTWYYLPLLSLTVISLHISKNFIYLINRWKVFSARFLFVQIVVVTIALTFWYILPFILFPAYKALIVVVIITLGTGFIFGNVFAPNHKQMPQIGENVRFSHLEKQIITASNVYTGQISNFFYFGLDLQIEHHLFPNTPRMNLKKISPFVKEICKKYNIPYTSTTTFQSVKQILRELKKAVDEGEMEIKNSKTA
ncbi:acyl-CoA desaturase [Chlamydiales bacterium]|nr:acyl-CoA desaturase [Chlamydiales bacterium]